MRNRISFLLLISLLSTSLCIAGWERIYGGALNDKANSITPTNDGHYLIVGITESFGMGTDSRPVAYLIKIDDNGDTLWTRTYGGSGHDVAHRAIETDEGDIFLACHTNSFGAGLTDFWLLKLDSNGDTVWTRTFGGVRGDALYDMIEIRDDGLLLIGDGDSHHLYGSKVYLVKTNHSGDIIWEKKYGSERYYQNGKTGIQLNDSSIIIVATRNLMGEDEDIWLLMIDNDTGDTLWTKTYGGPFHDWGKRLLKLDDGGFVLFGCYGINFPLDNDAWLMRFDEHGDTLWTRTFRIEQQSTRGNDIYPTSDGGYISIGTFGSFLYANGEIYLKKLDSDFGTVWIRTYGGSGYSDGVAVLETPGNGFIFTSNSNSFGDSNYNIYIVRTDSLGNSAVNEKTHSRHE